MSRKLHEIWKVQCPKGILSCKTKKQAIRWVESFKEVK